MLCENSSCFQATRPRRSALYQGRFSVYNIAAARLFGGEIFTLVVAPGAQDRLALSCPLVFDVIVSALKTQEGTRLQWICQRLITPDVGKTPDILTFAARYDRSQSQYGARRNP